MTALDPRLLIPPQEEEEVYPYRRVWRSLILEVGVVFGASIALYAAVDIFRLELPQPIRFVVSILIALAPLFVWLVWSWHPERSVPQPRQRLLAVVVITMLAANAVGIPLVEDFFQVERWLPLSSAINRIIGYTFTVGVVQETLKYLVLRYVVWDEHLRIRLDSVAYSVACAVGYATVLNLRFVLTDMPALDVIAVRAFETYVLQIAASIVVAYGLSEVRFSSPTPIFLTLTLALAAAIVGAAVPLRAGLVNAAIAVPISAPKPLLGLGFGLALVAASLLAVSFLFTYAERRAAEAARE